MTNDCTNVAWTRQLCTICYKRMYYSENRDKENNSRKIYNKKNKELMAKRKRKREQRDPQYKIANRVRHRIYTAVKNKNISTLELIGCTIEQLMLHLQVNFTTDMTWDNYGKWHIDHIKPLAKFNLQDLEQLKIACHYTNLQPLWASDNIKKRDYYVEEAK